MLAVEQFWAGHGDVSFHHQQLAIAMGGGLKSEANLTVDFRQIVVTALVGNTEIDIRVTLTKSAQMRRQPAGGPGRWRQNAQSLAQVGYAHGLHGPLDMVEGVAQVRGKGHACLGQRQALRCADKQRDAQVVFQLLDLTADGALGHVQAHGGLAETAMACDLFKDPQHI